MLPPVPLYFLRRQTDHSLLAPVLPQAAAPYGNMVTTRSNRLIQFAGTEQPPQQAGCSLNSWAQHAAAEAVQPALPTQQLGSASLRSERTEANIMFALLALPALVLTLGVTGTAARVAVEALYEPQWERCELG